MSNGWTSPGGDSPDGAPGAQAPPPPQYGQYGGQQPPPQYGQYGGQQPPPQYGQYGGQQPPPQYGQQPQYGQYGQYPQQYGPPAPFRLAPKPGVIPLRPLSLGDIFSGTFGTIRGNPGATLGLSALVALIVAVPAVLTTLALSGADLTTTDSSGTTVNLGTQLSSSVTAIYTAIAGIFLTGMLTAVVAEAVLGRRISIGETWQKVRGRLLPLLGMTLLVGLAFVIAAGIVVGIIVLLALTTSTALAVTVGILLGLGMLVAFIWAAIKVSLASPAIVLERVGPVAALRRSWSLSSGQWWRIFGITLLAQLIVGTISNIVQLPGAAVLVASAGDAGTPSVGAVLAVELVSVVVSALTAPFTAGVTALLYLDQRIRKEALDVTLMEAAAKDGAGGP
ncbi:hypothetical protein GCM10011492_31420 [Flexivirga endophytica]|uniref:DUF7847 domain-containing protein n=1 Tax=Flexivirga endophytica TaxID=1849103 RepID=A0A916TCL8_9MICO|nr:hypothetical protein [Flexivirga endophytica]GGB38389.1 hypothetical protein GCM10011492_31420 [Flexivirga endophytica]GHB46375.1 hypothetical protein GCM10008112_13810 [Flexivirga endophytica]